MPQTSCPNPATKLIRITQRQVLEACQATIAECLRTQTPPNFLLFTTILTNNPSNSSISTYIPQVRNLLTMVSLIATCLAQRNRMLIGLSKYAREFNSALIEDIATWVAVSHTASISFPNLHSAYVLYTNLVTLENTKFIETETDNRNINMIIEDEHHFVLFMIDLLRPYANAFLQSKNQRLSTLHKWDRSKIPALIEKYVPQFLQIAEERNNQFEQSKEISQTAPIVKAESKNKKRRRQRHQPKQLMQPPAHKVIPVETVPQPSLSCGSPHLSPDQIIQLPRAADMVPVSPLVLAVTSETLSTTQEEKEKSSSKLTAWKKSIAAQRAEKQIEEEQTRNRIVAAHKKEIEEKEKKNKQPKLQNSVRLLALYKQEQNNFIAYLNNKGLTKDPIYQAILKPRSRTKSITQDDLDRLFNRLCDLLKIFLDENNIGSPEDRDPFVENIRQDLLGTRHNLHNTGERGLPDNYIIHRRSALIYAGLIPLELMEQVTKDNRSAIELYSIRLLSRVLSSDKKN